MTDRNRLPQRRNAELVSFTHEGVSYTAHFGCDGNGRLAEIFLDAAKEGSTANTVARECAVITSIALQYGTPLSVLRDALPKLHDGSPAGPVGVALSHFSEGRAA